MLSEKKLSELLSTKYENNPIRLVRETSQQEISGPYIDTVGRAKVITRVDAFVREVGNYADAVKRGFHEMGYQKLAEEVDYYHFGKAPQRTYSDDKVAERLLIKAFNSLLKIHERDPAVSEEARIVRMLARFCLVQFETPLEDKLQHPITKEDEIISVSLLTLINHYGGSSWKMVQAYLKATDKNRILEEFKPYHCALVPDFVYQDEAIMDGMLERMMSYHLNKAKYGGSLQELVDKIPTGELEEDFLDTVCGEKIFVSSKVLFAKHGHSPTNIIERYVGLVEASEQIRLPDGKRPRVPSPSSRDSHN